MIKYIFAVVIFFFCQQAIAHEAPSGWSYPPECCGGNDCAPIDKMVTLDDGSMVVTTKHGTATFPKDFSNIRVSPDDKQHACFLIGANSDGSKYTVPFCLFLLAGV